MTAEERKVQALKIVKCGMGMGLTHYANTLVSRQAKALLSDGLIAYGSGSLAYTLTRKGEQVLDAHCATPGCFVARGACSHGGQP